MIKFASESTGIIYRSIVKPILFSKPPDDVHELMLSTAGYLNRHRFIREKLRSVYRYDAPNLTQTIHGITFHNPIGISAGLDKNCQLPLTADMIGMGMIEVGSMTAKQCSGNERPWFHRLPKSKSLVVYAGLANRGVDVNIETLQRYPAELWDKLVLNISVAKTNCQATANDKAGIEDYCQALEKVNQSGLAKLITINISCPNTYGGEPFTDPKRLRQLLRQVEKLHLDAPVFLKLPIDKPWSEFKKILDVAAQFSIAGVTIGNLAKDRTKAHLQENLDQNIKGGLSGKPTWDLSNELIRQTYEVYGQRFTIIGVGGVFSGQDAWHKLTLGAQLVELITGLVFQGPQLCGQMNHYVSKRLEREGRTLQDIIGSRA